MTLRHTALVTIAALGLLAACSTPGKDEPGDEYMPDMGHSIAYEANQYFNYYYNQWDSASVKSRYALSQPGLPVDGTVPRGYAGFYLAGQAAGQDAYRAQLAQVREQYGVAGLQTIKTPMNGAAPYYYNDTEPDRLRAIADLTVNPFPITENGLKRGQEFYEIFCGICHGNDGGGNGWIYENESYPAAPRNFLDQAWVDTSAGVYYHAIMHGKNVMGAYRDKLNYEERFQVIHYIRALQAKWAKRTYDASGNDLVPREATAGNTRLANLMDAISNEPIDYESSKASREVVPGNTPASIVPGQTPNASDTTRIPGVGGRTIGGLSPKPAPRTGSGAADGRR